MNVAVLKECSVVGSSFVYASLFFIALLVWLS